MNYYQDINSTLSVEAEDAFENHASEYDETFSASVSGNVQRQSVYRYLSGQKFFQQQLQVLELNCGTGTDAIWMASFGHSITATDRSKAMLEVAEKKKIHANPDTLANVRFLQMNLQEVKETLGDQQYNLVFSDFGGLNCLSPDEIKKLGSQLFSILVNPGKLIIVLMGRKCWWEKIYFQLKSDRLQSQRRSSKQAVNANVAGKEINIYYYSPDELATLMKEYFQVIRKIPVGLFVPPSYLNNKIMKWSVFRHFLPFLEKFARYFPRMADYADHYLIEFQKKTEQAL